MSSSFSALDRDRLAALMKTQMKAMGYNGVSLAKAMEVSPQTVYEWRRTDKQPSSENLAKLADLLGFSPDAVYRSDDAEVASPARVVDLKSLGLIRIPHMSIEASAGDGSEVVFEEEEGETILPANYARRRFGVAPDRIRRITVVGISMVPTVYPGEGVYIILLDPGETLLDGSIYLMRSPHGLLFKRVFFEAKVNDSGEVIYTVRISSDNPEVSDSTLPIEVFNRDYHAIAVFRTCERNL
ncbi:MAG: helix-turn-helix domain-containing protein [Bacteroidota bacterium]